MDTYGQPKTIGPLPLAQGAVAHRAGERRPAVGRGLRQRRHRAVDRRCTGPLPWAAAGDRSPRRLGRRRSGTVARRAWRAARDRQRATRRQAMGAEQLDAASRAREGAGYLTDTLPAIAAPLSTQCLL